MDAEEILTRVRDSAERPQHWTVFPLLYSKVLGGIVGWVIGIILGLGLLVVIAPAVIPYNFMRGAAAIIFTILLLGLLVFVTGGSLVLLVIDILRLIQADRHIIVVTEEDFVKQEGRKVIHVPLTAVRHVTPRGRTPANSTPVEETEENDTVRQIPGVGEGVLGFFMGRGSTASGMKWRRKRMRTPTSLAFIDIRTNREVTVVNDNSYGDPFMIAAVLKQYANAIKQ
jgi:hypothetical protein